MSAAFWFRPAIVLRMFAAFALSAAFSGASLSAASPEAPKRAAERTADAQALVEEALAAEVDGRDADRTAALAKAEALAPEFPAIHWHRGMILADGEWVPAEDAAVSSENRALLEEYVAKRDAAENTLAAHLALSKWCQEKGLFAQERAHLVRVLTFDPNHAVARARLGFVRVGEEWISREEIAASIAEQAKNQAAIRSRRGSLRNLAESLVDPNPAVRENAAERVRAIRDASLIPALEAQIAAVGEEASLAVLDALAAMPEKEATRSLARFAALSPSYRVRGEAAKALQARPFDQFVPALLASMTGPLQDEWALTGSAGGGLILRHAAQFETSHAVETAVRDTVYFVGPGAGTRLTMSRTDVAAAETRNLQSAQRDAAVRSALTTAHDKVAEADRLDLNARIAAVLETATGQSLGTDARQWWNWWDQYNELRVSGQKPVRVQYALQSVSVPAASVIRVAVLGDSCFAAGTLVLTDRGEIAIEQVRVGDLVLAQDVESGELAFKPVLETTIRPPVEILRMEHEGGTLRTTGGHPFWVSGEGWVHARRLKSGMELHTPTGTVRVSEVVSDGEEPAYNLVVADFANYFVGEARILCHDNTSRLPTDAIVPGLTR